MPSLRPKPSAIPPPQHSLSPKHQDQHRPHSPLVEARALPAAGCGQKESSNREAGISDGVDGGVGDGGGDAAGAFNPPTYGNGHRVNSSYGGSGGGGGVSRSGLEAEKEGDDVDAPLSRKQRDQQQQQRDQQQQQRPATFARHGSDGSLRWRRSFLRSCSLQNFKGGVGGRLKGGGGEDKLASLRGNIHGDANGKGFSEARSRVASAEATPAESKHAAASDFARSHPHHPHSHPYHHHHHRHQSRHGPGNPFFHLLHQNHHHHGAEDKEEKEEEETQGPVFDIPLVRNGLVRGRISGRCTLLLGPPHGSAFHHNNNHHHNILRIGSMYSVGSACVSAGGGTSGDSESGGGISRAGDAAAAEGVGAGGRGHAPIRRGVLRGLARSTSERWKHFLPRDGGGGGSGGDGEGEGGGEGEASRKPRGGPVLRRIGSRSGGESRGRGGNNSFPALTVSASSPARSISNVNSSSINSGRGRQAKGQTLRALDNTNTSNSSEAKHNGVAFGGGSKRARGTLRSGGPSPEGCSCM